MDLTGQTFAGLEVISKCGGGGMGTVFKARQPLLDRLVALKVMSPKLSDDPDFVARFIREAASAAKLHHDNMVLVHSAGEQNGIYYIVMEYVEGHSLHEHIQRKGRLDPIEALAITVYIAQALQYAWNKAQLIHRDIKPANVFLSNAGEVKVGDLGLAKSVGSETTGMTQTGVVFGSPHYISPEQARGVKDIDFRTDIYSLGCTLFHMLTGQPPYDGTDTMSIMMKHVADPPPAIFKVLPTCPVPLGRLVGKMLAKKPNERHQSYEELIADVYAVTDKLSASASMPAAASAPPTQPAATAPTPKAQHKTSPATIYVIAGAVGVMLLAGLLLWSPWRSREVGPSIPAGPSASATVPSLGKENEEVKGMLPASVSPVASAVPAVKKSEVPAVLDAFVKEVAALPAEEQVKRVVTKLKELNPGFDGRETHEIEGGKVSALRFPAMAVSDISPIRALTDLRSLFCCGNKEQHALADLSPLRGLPLTDLNCSFTAVTDLSPLQGMPLKKLVCFSTPVQDLTPLQSSPLEEFHCSGSQVGDLTPIKNLPLRMLLCEATKVTDATPLRGMPLRELRWTFNPERDTEAILAIKTLEKINDVPVAEFWKKVDPELVAKAKAAALPGASTMPALSPAATTKVQTGQPFVSLIGMELLYIPPGEFMMRSPKEEQMGAAPRKTMIAQGFWLGRTEVTVVQWKEFVTATGYKTDAEKKGYVDYAPRKGQSAIRGDGLNWRDPGFGEIPQDNHPVCCVSWNDAVAFCEWATERERKAGRLSANQVVRLPTEAEWEYACRAGAQTKFWWGDTTEGCENRVNWYGTADGFEFVSPVDHYGSRGRNKFGLADMLGNVHEWCLDEYDATQAHEECYRGNPSARVERGGSFRDLHHPGCAGRTGYTPSYSNNNRGFRVAVGTDKFGTTTATASTSPAGVLKQTEVQAPAETRGTALTANPKVGEVYRLDMGKGVTMELMGIPPGEFMLGSTKEEQAWAALNGSSKNIVSQEGDQPRKTMIKEGFWLGRTEVTVGQWKAFVTATGYKTDAEKKGYVDYALLTKGQPGSRGDNLSWRDPGFGEPPRDNHPVCCVSWNDAVAFCEWLTERERKAGRLTHGYAVRLPTEAEWEYACRAGTQTKFWWGESSEDGKDRLNWVGKEDGFEYVAPVDSYGERGRNGFGLADILGNVYEWCLDEFDAKQAHEECYKGDPRARVLRGGSFYYGPGIDRCAFRHKNPTDRSVSFNGFRVAVGVAR